MGKTKVFVIMPFAEDYIGLYKYIKTRFSDEYDFNHAGDLDNQQNILKDIVLGICEADIILADLTSLNPNVFYELGLCHAIGKKVISITQSISELPFDIKQYRVTQYNPHIAKVTTLIDELSHLLRAASDGTMSFGNPLADFAPTYLSGSKMQEASDVKHEDMGITEIEVVGDEKGYLDIFSEIESGASAFTAEIDEMSEHMNIMTDNINKGTEEINRVSSNNASGIASFVRGIARKVAEHISKFDEQMVKHNLNLKVAWMNIENNCLDLIDNKHIASSDNKEVLRKLTDVLKLIKSATIQSNESVYTMIGSISAIKGVERRLNQSANSLESQMSDFLAIMENLIASVDRIVEKSKILHDSL